MKKNIIDFLFIGILLFFTSCSALKTIKLLNKGSVVQKEFNTEIPFELTASGHILVKVKIKGVYHKFIFDTGAPNAISKEMAEEIKSKSLVETKTTDSQNKKQGLNLVELDSVFVNDICFLNTAALVIDLKKSNEVRCLGAEGLLGNNIMKNAVWQIDFARKIITLSSIVKEWHESTPKFSFTTNATCLPKINLSIGGITDKDVTIDFGSNGYYHTVTSVFKALKKQGNVTKYTYAFGSTSSGLFGAQTDTTFYAIVPEWSMQSLTFKNNLISFSEKTQKTIGCEFFKNYITTLDFKNHLIYLYKISEPQEKSGKSYGFSPVLVDEKLTVGKVIASSKVFKIGVKAGDQIVSINDTSYEKTSADMYCDFMSFFMHNEASMKVVFLSNGTMKEIDLTKEEILKRYE